MSRVYFHSSRGDAELHGSEFAYLGCLCGDIAVGLARFGELRADVWGPLTNPTHDLARKPFMFSSWRRAFETAFRIEDPDLLLLDGAPLSTRDLILNTALQVGDDAVRLAARLYGQGELHAWVDGRHRAWLAGVMRAGLQSGVLRARLPGRGVDQGWAEVIALLESDDTGPVVTSYSVCEGFPNPGVAGWRPAAGVDLTPGWVSADAAGRREWAALDAATRQEYRRERVVELWGELPAERRWELAVEGLRRGPGMLVLTPETWRGFRFGRGLSVLDLTGSRAGR